jgi:hypothetical protein
MDSVQIISAFQSLRHKHAKRSTANGKFAFNLKPASLGRGNVLAVLFLKGMFAKKFRGAQQKSGLKPPPPGVDNNV